MRNFDAILLSDAGIDRENDSDRLSIPYHTCILLFTQRRAIKRRVATIVAAAYRRRLYTHIAYVC